MSIIDSNARFEDEDKAMQKILDEERGLAEKNREADGGERFERNPMSDLRIIVQSTVIREGTASQMRRRYPDEYEAFMVENPDADDKDWLLDCLDNGGDQVFDPVDNALDYQFHQVEEPHE